MSAFFFFCDLCRGLAALEVLAMDMRKMGGLLIIYCARAWFNTSLKQTRIIVSNMRCISTILGPSTGMYVARMLSFEGTSFEVVNCPLDLQLAEVRSDLAISLQCQQLNVSLGII